MRRPSMHGEIEAYADSISVRPGTVVRLMVSTSAARYDVKAFRIGWYHGDWATRVWRSSWIKGHRQHSWQFSNADRRTVVASWHPSSLVPTAGWSPGFYIMTLTTGNGWQTQVPLVVRSAASHGKVALVVPVATWQAYNAWGGYSLYVGAGGDHHSYAVSFDRPWKAPALGATSMANGVVQIVARAERLGIPLSYLTDIDLDRHPATLNGASAYVDLGHAEYWSRGMRSRVEQARADGTNLAFFGANTMYWRVRLQNHGRVVVGYRDAAALDPVGARHPRLSTARWRDHPRADPEEALTGMDYECYPVESAYRVVSPHWWGFRGVRVRRGSRFPQLVGVEADRVYPVRPTPKRLQILSYHKYSCRGVLTSTESTYYTARSGAGVFDAGTLRWSCAMTRACRGAHISPRTKQFVDRVTDRVLLVFSHPRAGRAHPAHRNVRRFWLPKVNEVPAS